MKKLYFIATHPYDLIIYKLIYPELCDRYSIILIIFNHRYFDKYEYSFLINFYNKVYQFKYIDYSKNIPSVYNQSINIKNKLKTLDVDENDIFINCTQTSFPVNIIMSIFRKNKHITLRRKITVENEQNSSDKLSVLIKKNILNNICEIVTNSYLTKTFDVNRTKNVNKIFYYKKNFYITLKYFDLLDEKIHKDSCFNLFVNYESNKNNNASDYIYFFGSRMNDWNFINSSEKQLIHNMIQDYISYLKSKGFNVIYVAHPLEKNINDFKDCTYNIEKLNAEMIFLKYSQDIKFTFSIGSTSTVSSLNFGIPSLAIYRIFNIEKMSKAFEALFKNLPSYYFPNNYDELCKFDFIKNYQDAITNKSKISIRNFV